MELIIANDYLDLSKTAAEYVEKRIQENPAFAVALPSGKTPLGMYQELAKRFQEGKIDFSKARVFELDEYVGLAPHDEKSFSFFLSSEFLDKVNVQKENIHLISGIGDAELISTEYEAEILKHPLDAAILGLGTNGHIAFNEPGTPFDSETRIVDLSAETIKRNKTEATQAITVGIKTIMKAKEILLIASGIDKAEAVQKMIEGDISEQVPASILQQHLKVTVLIDREAASKLAIPGG